MLWICAGEETGSWQKNRPICTWGLCLFVRLLLQTKMRLEQRNICAKEAHFFVVAMMNMHWNCTDLQSCGVYCVCLQALWDWLQMSEWTLFDFCKGCCTFNPTEGAKVAHHFGYPCFVKFSFMLDLKSLSLYHCMYPSETATLMLENIFFRFWIKLFSTTVIKSAKRCIKILNHIFSLLLLNSCRQIDC